MYTMPLKDQTKQRRISWITWLYRHISCKQGCLFGVFRPLFPHNLTMDNKNCKLVNKFSICIARFSCLSDRKLPLLRKNRRCHKQFLPLGTSKFRPRMSTLKAEVKIQKHIKGRRVLQKKTFSKDISSQAVKVGEILGGNIDLSSWTT